MASQRQLNANRRNAKRGGPKTEEGKARTRLNALRHGLAAGHVLLPHEDLDAFHTLRNRMLHDYTPENQTEEKTVEQLVRAVWKLERINDAEADLFNLEIQTEKKRQGHSTKPDPAIDTAGVAVVLVSQPAAHFDNFFRYQAAIERSYYRALAAAKNILKDRQQRKLAEERLAIQRHKAGMAAPAPQHAAAAGQSKVSENGIRSVQQSEHASEAGNADAYAKLGFPPGSGACPAQFDSLSDESVSQNPQSDPSELCPQAA